MAYEFKLLEGSKLRGYPVLPRFSWHSELGFVNDQENCHACLKPRALFDLGKSKSFFFEQIDIYAMLRGLYLDQIHSKGYGTGFGLVVGLFYTPSTKTRGYISTSKTLNLTGAFLDEWQAAWNFDGPRELDFRFSAKIQQLDKKTTKKEWSLAIGYSF